MRTLEQGALVPRAVHVADQNWHVRTAHIPGTLETKRYAECNYYVFKFKDVLVLLQKLLLNSGIAEAWVSDWGALGGCVRPNLVCFCMSYVRTFLFLSQSPPPPKAYGWDIDPFETIQGYISGTKFKSH